jgi:hypothetical protein
MKKYIFIFLCVSIFLSINAQELSSLSYLFQFDIKFNSDIESVKPVDVSCKKDDLTSNKSWLQRKIFHESFFEIKNKNQQLNIDPF